MANCAQCGNTLTSSDRFCAVCGRPVPAVQASAASISSSTALPQTLAQPAPTSGKAIASLICGVFLFVLPAAIAAVTLGHLSLSDIKKSGGRIQGRGLAIAGLVLGYLGLAVIPIGIIAAIAIPNLLRARIAANEASAVNSIRTIYSAEVSYLEQHSATGFTCDLQELKSTGKIDAELASGTKNGYSFSLKNCPSQEMRADVLAYTVVAAPLRYNQTGVRTFCSDQSAAIKYIESASSNRCLESGQNLQ